MSIVPESVQDGDEGLSRLLEGVVRKVLLEAGVRPTPATSSSAASDVPPSDAEPEAEVDPYDWLPPQAAPEGAGAVNHAGIPLTLGALPSAGNPTVIRPVVTSAPAPRPTSTNLGIGSALLAHALAQGVVRPVFTSDNWVAFAVRWPQYMAQLGIVTDNEKLQFLELSLDSGSAAELQRLRERDGSVPYATLWSWLEKKYGGDYEALMRAGLRDLRPQHDGKLTLFARGTNTVDISNYTEDESKA